MLWVLEFVLLSHLFESAQGNKTKFNCSMYDMFHNFSVLEIPFQCAKYPVATEVFLGVVFIVIVVGAIGGNFLVILAVAIVKKLQTPNNFLIVSLAFSDFFVSLLVMPVAVYNQMVRFRWHFSETFCDLYISLDVLFCTSSIMNLCAISIDRYLLITRPMVYAVRRTPALMAAMIVGAWLISFLISIPPVLGMKNPFVPGRCDYSDNVSYQICATVGAFYIPLIIMLVLYFRIFKLAQKMALEDAKRKGVSELVPDEDVFQPPPTPCRTNSGEEESKLLRFQHIPSLMVSSQIESSDKDSGQRSTSRQRTKRIKASTDSKAITTLGVIMGCFTLCWLPFFIMQIIKPILTISGINHNNYLLPWLWELFLWLGYVNSFLNPVIYAKFNREFRTPFKEILFCHCTHINSRLRSESYAEQYGLPSFKTSANSHHPDSGQFMGSRRSSQVPFTPVSQKNKLRLSSTTSSKEGRTII